MMIKTLLLSLALIGCATPYQPSQQIKIATAEAACNNLLNKMITSMEVVYPVYLGCVNKEPEACQILEQARNQLAEPTSVLKRCDEKGLLKPTRAQVIKLSTLVQAYDQALEN